MKVLRGTLLTLCLCLLSVGAFADSVTAQFTIDVNGNPVTSQGSISFTLEANGTIDASLTITNGANIIGFGFNSATPDLPESNFSPTQPDNMTAGSITSASNRRDFSAPRAERRKHGPSTVTTRRFSMFWMVPRPVHGRLLPV